MSPLKRVLAVAGVFGLVCAATGAVLLPGVLAADPGQGTIGPGNPAVSWNGPTYAVAAVADPAACAPPDPGNLCDHYQLTVAVGPGWWYTNTGGAAITITWANADNDFDLYVYDTTGAEVQHSANSNTTAESVLVQDASGVYEVRVVPFSVVNSSYTGTARFVSTPGGSPNPPRPTGGLAFGPATAIDPQRTEGEPVSFIDPQGNYWESGPWGTSTQNSFVHRSTDGGDSFHIVSPVQLRPDPGPGGGDTDVTVDDQGNAYFVDLEGLVNLSCAISNDNGNTWRKNDACVQNAGVDRQWFALDNGPTAAAADNTVFLAFRNAALGSYIYSSPGSTGPGDPTGGFVYINASASPNAVSTGAPCGQLRFDRGTRNLYYPCVEDDQVMITRGHVDPGQRTGITFTTVLAPVSPGGLVGDIFPAVDVDAAGNVYAVWIDENDHNVYYAASTDQGQTWGAVQHVNGNDANSNVFVWARGGSAGTLAIAWYGTPTRGDSDVMPSWYNDRVAAARVPWYGYVALVRNATSPTPDFIQQRFTAKPMHYGQICNGGIGCTVSNGDRTMADFFAFTFDAAGGLRLVYNDTTSQHHGAHLFEVRQLAGPTAFGGTLSRPVPANPMPDATGDAQWPHYAPGGPGANLPQFDFTELRLGRPASDTLRVVLTLADLAALTPPAGKATSLWIARFQALSDGDHGEEAYRIFYVGAESVGTGTPVFFAGSGSAADGPTPGTGCTVTTEENCKIVQYPVEYPATGCLQGNQLIVDVNLRGGFGATRPVKGTRLYNVTAFSGGRSNQTTDLYADVDATAAFDYVLPPPQALAGCSSTPILLQLPFIAYNAVQP